MFIDSIELPSHCCSVVSVTFMDIFVFRTSHLINTDGLFNPDNVTSDDLDDLVLRLKN